MRISDWSSDVCSSDLHLDCKRGSEHRPGASARDVEGEQAECHGGKACTHERDNLRQEKMPINAVREDGQHRARLRFAALHIPTGGYVKPVRLTIPQRKMAETRHHNTHVTGKHPTSTGQTCNTT